MNSFDHFVPTQVKFGGGRLAEAGGLVSSIGRRCLIVTGPASNALYAASHRTIDFLKGKNVEAFLFDGVVANPTRESIEQGINLAVEHRADCLLALGGGSAIDSAKTIALLFFHRKKIDWETFCAEHADPFPSVRTPPRATLSLIAVPTTSGTGSHVTQAAVVTDSLKKEKVTIFHPKNFPLISIVDPELMVTMPNRVTAATGFDAFSHAFESLLGKRLSPLTEMMALEAIRLIVDNLPQALRHPADMTYRTRMAWADTLAGMCLANGGAAIPHPLGEIIGGICPRISHGETLAMIYPEFMRFQLAKSPEQYARVAVTIKPELSCLPPEEAAGILCLEIDRFLKEIGLWISMRTYRISESEYEEICASGILSRIGAAGRDELLTLFRESRERKRHEPT